MQEIERKFLIDLAKWKPTKTSVKIEQGYLSADPERVVRVRVAGQKSYLSIKGKTTGISRIEMEYEIPLNEANVLLKMCLDVPIKKTRFFDYINGQTWEIDVFEGANEGLVLAEIELEDETQNVDLPDWIAREVSGDHRFFNSWLSKHPYSTWGKEIK
jgi:adenylate cyclase